MTGIRKLFPGTNPLTGNVLLIAALLVLSVYYQYHKTLFYHPQSVHAWRQSDCASLSLNYYKHGMKFFQPQIHLLASDSGTSGYAATSEIPLFYYTIAVLYKIFGVNEFLIRLMNLLIFLCGLFYLFRLFSRLLKDYFWSFGLAILLFTSPLLVYYGNNYLTNASALSLGIVGFYHFYCFYENRKLSSLIWSAVFYFLAGSFKITGLFLVFAILAHLLLEWAGIIPSLTNRVMPSAREPSPGVDNRQSGIRVRGILQIMPFIVVLALVFGWVIYAGQYNSRHNSMHFSTTIFPIWHFDLDGIRGILNGIRENWLPSYFNRYTLILIGLLGVSIPVNHKYIHPLFLSLTTLLLPVVILFILLQFWTFRDHDYYLINLYILVIMIIASAFSGLMNRFPRLTDSYAVKVAFALFLLMNIVYARQEHAERYTGWMNENSGFLEFREIRDKLPEFGIHPDDTVICLPGTSQLALYLVDMKGWTAYIDARYNKGGAIYYNRDSTGIRESIDRGAKYLFVMGMDEIYRNPWLMDFSHDLAGQHGEILVFDLLSDERNFTLGNRPLKLHVSCDMESLSGDGRFFRTSVDSVGLDFGLTQSTDLAFSGKHSSKLTSQHTYSLTRVFPHVKTGESFIISAWLFDPEDRCRIIASGPDPERFYFSRRNIDVTDSLGWRKIRTDFFIPAEMNGEDIKVYMHYPGSDSAYVDDFEILYFDKPGAD